MRDVLALRLILVAGFALAGCGYRVSGGAPRGLPAAVLADCPPGRRLRIPMRPGVRSLNLSNAVAVVVYEAWRQLAWR